MEVRTTKDLGDGHLIEVGNATWDGNETSIRNRYPTSTGGFSPRSSSEIPLEDVSEILTVAVDENLLRPAVLVDLMVLISGSLKRQLE